MPLTNPILPSPGRPKVSTTDSLMLPGVALTGSVGTLAPGNNTLYYFPIYVAAPLTITGLLLEVTTLAASGKARVGIYNADSDLQPTSLIVDGGELDCSSTGVKEATISTTLAPGRYLLAAVCNSGTIQVRYARGGSERLGVLPGLGANMLRAELTVTNTYGALASTGVAWTATGGFSSPPPWFLFCRVAS